MPDQEFYYYYRWKFNSPPDPSVTVGPYHSTCVTNLNPREFLSSMMMSDLNELFVKVFQTQTEMESYWNKQRQECE